MEEFLRDAGVEFTNKYVAEDEEALVELERIPPSPPIAPSHDLKMCRPYPDHFLAVRWVAASLLSRTHPGWSGIKLGTKNKKVGGCCLAH
jgi:hypothetical protein